MTRNQANKMRALKRQTKALKAENQELRSHVFKLLCRISDLRDELLKNPQWEGEVHDL